MPFRSSLVVVVAAACLPSCSQFTFQSQSIAMRAVDLDAVELRLVYRGLGPGDYGEQQAAEAIAKLVSDRSFAVLDPMLTIDVHQLAKMHQEERSEPAAYQRLASWLQGLQITEAGVFETQGGELLAWQVVRIPGLVEGLKRINDAISAGIRSELVRDDGHLGPPPLGDPDLRDRYLAATANGYSWAQLDDRGLTLRFPASPRGLAHALRQLVDGVASERRPASAGLFDALAEVAVEDGNAELRFAPGPDGWMHWHAANTAQESSKTFVAKVHAAAGKGSEPPDWVRRQIAED